MEYAYSRAGTHPASVDIEWSGTYRLNGGAPQPITGRVSTAGEPVEVQVREARTELVAG